MTLQTYSETCYFCAKHTDFQKQSVESAFKLLAKSLKVVFDEVHFIILFIKIQLKNLKITWNVRLFIVRTKHSGRL